MDTGTDHGTAAARYAPGTGALAPSSRVASEDFVSYDSDADYEDFAGGDSDDGGGGGGGGSNSGGGRGGGYTQISDDDAGSNDGGGGGEGADGLEAGGSLGLLPPGTQTDDAFQFGLEFSSR